MKDFKVFMKSVPGMYAQYEGQVEVYAKNIHDAIEKAFDQLKRGAYPDRDRSMWKVIKVETEF